MVWDIVFDALRSSVLVTGLVVVMMMLIECINIDSQGSLLGGLKRSRFTQVLFSALLGIIPGCMGGFASVSLYTHGVISFGALVAMMIASSGDEAFMMLALIPRQAVWISLVLLALAVVTGILVDSFIHPKTPRKVCEAQYSIHEEDVAAQEDHHASHGSGRHLSWQRALMFLGVVAFIAALLSGLLEHEHGEGGHEGFNLLNEDWMYWMFGALSLIVIGVLLWGSDHFVKEHFWHHIVVRHLPSVFFWTFGVLLLVGVLLQFVDISSWISENTALMILLAAAVGIIPESGPHLIFVTLYASGIVPLPVLLASCISQDGHASLPLIAESKRTFLLAKSLNVILAVAVGFAALLL